MNRNIISMIFGGAAVLLLILGYQYYESHRSKESVEIKLDGNGISIQKD
jgi:hypothetical protein